MSHGTFYWMGRSIPFREGDSIAAAFEAAGILSFGRDTRYFCGIGACQNCLIRIDGTTREACLIAARNGMRVESLEGGHD